MTSAKKLRATPDTTLFVAAIARGGSGSLKALEAWRDGHCELITSHAIIEEIERVLRLQHANGRGIELTVTALHQNAIVVQPHERISACRDSDDNKILEAAIAGQADCIVSDDKDLRALSPFRGIKIITVNRFLRRLGISRKRRTQA